MSYHNTAEVYIIEKKNKDGEWVRNTPHEGVYYTTRQRAQDRINQMREENATSFIIKSSRLTATVRPGARGYNEARDMARAHIDFCDSIRISTIRRA